MFGLTGPVLTEVLFMLASDWRAGRRRAEGLRRRRPGARGPLEAVQKFVIRPPDAPHCLGPLDPIHGRFT
jgi:hypothetical protein